MIPLHGHIVLHSIRCFSTLETPKLVVSHTEIFQGGYVFEHAGEAEESELFDVKRSIIVVAVNKITFEVAILLVEAEFVRIGEDY